VKSDSFITDDVLLITTTELKESHITKRTIQQEDKCICTS